MGKGLLFRSYPNYHTLGKNEEWARSWAQDFQQAVEFEFSRLNFFQKQGAMFRTVTYIQRSTNKKRQVKEYRRTYQHKSSGRRMVSYSVDKNGRFVTLRSFPLDVIRTGMGVPRSSKRYLGEQIMSNFQSAFNSEASAISAQEIEAVFARYAGQFKTKPSGDSL